MSFTCTNITYSKSNWMRRRSKFLSNKFENQSRCNIHEHFLLNYFRLLYLLYQDVSYQPDVFQAWVWQCSAVSGTRTWQKKPPTITQQSERVLQFSNQNASYVCLCVCLNTQPPCSDPSGIVVVEFRIGRKISVGCGTVRSDDESECRSQDPDSDGYG